MMATPNRIYLITVKQAEGAPASGAPRLVRAPNQAQAIRHVAADMLVADVASQDDLVMMLGQGVKVETSGRQQAEGGEA